jgi:hypothetical protein
MACAALIAAALLAIMTPRSSAHEGPPYPIVVDRAVGSFVVSVWGDPDVGIGTFWIALEPAAGTSLPDSCVVAVFVRPADGRLPEARHAAKPERSPRGSKRFQARAAFDRAGPWSLRIRVSSPRGGGEACAGVDVTPPGQGPALDFVLYGFPFVAVAFLFLKAALRRERAGTRG